MNVRSLKRVNMHCFFATAYLLFIALIIMSQSPFFWVNIRGSGTDSSVFQTIAMMMGKGYMPYRDSFDHKGPLIYLIDYLGMRISPIWGILLIEVMFMGSTLFAMYRIARLLCGRAASCVILAVASMPLLNWRIFNYTVSYFCGGNLVEEYAMPFIAAALYIFLDYLYNGNVSKPRLTVCGLCMGGVCLLRVNMISIWVVFCIFIAARCILKKDFATLGQFIGYFLAGVCIIVLPILAWLALNDALVPFWNDYIRFNMAYTSHTSAESIGQGLMAKCGSFIFFFCGSPIVCLFPFTVYVAYTDKAKQQTLCSVYAVCLFVSTLFIAISGRMFLHYGMALVPLFVFPLAFLYERCSERIKGLHGCKAGAALLLAAVTAVYLLSACINLLWMRSADRFSNLDAINDICAVIDENAAPDEPISVVGNRNIFYVASGRPHATAYSYQYPIGLVAPAIMDDYLRQLAEEMPKLIIVSFPSYLDMIEPFLSEHGYTLIWSSTDSSVLVYSCPV